MADVFISYAGEDHEVVMPVVRALESAGYSAWYYERDCPAFRSHLDATGAAIEQSQVVALIVSPHSLASHEVDNEVQWAHRVVRPIAPILVDTGWEEFETRQPRWRRIIGTGVGINVRRSAVDESVPRILAGLEALGIRKATPVPPPAPEPALPHLLAVIFHRQAARPAAGARGLGEVVEGVVQYLAAIAVAGYRQTSSEPGSDDPEVEQWLKALLQPALEHWSAALDVILFKQRLPQGPLFGVLTAFLTGRHENDAVAAAYMKFQDWLDFRPRRRPPFSYADFLNAALLYCNSPEAGGGSPSAEASAARTAALQPALDALLKDLAFLPDYPLVLVAPDGRAWDAMAAQLSPRDAPLCAAEAAAGHVYVCRPDEDSVASFLDLSPLLIAATCAQCRELRLFVLRAGRQGIAEYYAAACGHTLALAADREKAKALAIYLTAALWQGRERPFKVLPEHQPYLDELQEILAHGEPSPADRVYLDSMAQMYGLSPEVCKRLEESAPPPTAPSQEPPVLPKEPAEPRLPPERLPPVPRPPGSRVRSLDDVVAATRVQAADLGMLGIDSTFLFATLLKSEGSATVRSFDRLGLPAGLFSTLLARLEKELAPLRRTSKHTDPGLSESVEAIVKLARKLAAASDAPPTETHLLEAFVLHRKNGIMRLLAQLDIEPERLLPGPWRADGSFDQTRFSEPVLAILREAFRHACTYHILGSPQILAAVASTGSEAARKRLGIPADDVAGYTARTLDTAAIYGERPMPAAITWDLCSARAERILNLAELLAREARALVQEEHLVEAIARTQPGS